LAKLYISEFSDVLQTGNGPVQIAAQPSLVDQAPVTVGVTANVSSAFGAATRFIRVHTDVICSILISAVGTAATANNARMAANQTEYFKVNAGDFLSVITNT
jgi:hypothetical protein